MSTQTNNSGNSYLSFKLGDESFAVMVDKVHEIIEVPTITKVPKSPEFMVGVINLRGSVMPVIDTRIKFGLSKFEFIQGGCIVIFSVTMENEEVIIGALVDSVLEVFEITSDNIQPSPAIGSKYKSEFIEGMVKSNDQFIMILNIDEVFSLNELTQVKESTLEN